VDCIQFFKQIDADLDILFQHADSDEAIRKFRCNSVALRIAGVAIAAFSAFNALLGLSLFLVHPILSLPFLAIAFCGTVISHDLIQVGVNASRLLSIRNAMHKNAGALDAIGQVATGAFYNIKAAYQGEDVYLLEGTWVFGRIFNQEAYGIGQLRDCSGKRSSRLFSI